MSTRSISRSIKRRGLRASVAHQLRALAARGWTPPAEAALVVDERTGELLGFVPIEEQRAFALETARDGVNVRELLNDGSERHVIERYVVGGAS